MSPTLAFLLIQIMLIDIYEEEFLTKFWNNIDTRTMFISPSSKIIDTMLDQEFFVFGKSEIYRRSFWKEIQNTKSEYQDLCNSA